MSILYDFECAHCKTKEERFVPIDERNDQRCVECGELLERMLLAKPDRAFTPHFSSSLGVYLESRQQREKELKSIYYRSVAPLSERP